MPNTKGIHINDKTQIQLQLKKGFILASFKRMILICIAINATKSFLLFIHYFILIVIYKCLAVVFWVHSKNLYVYYLISIIHK